MRINCGGLSHGALEGPVFRHEAVQHHLKHEDVYFVLDGLKGNGNDQEVCDSWKVFCVADGHGGRRCANFVKRHLGPILLQLLPSSQTPPLCTAEGAEYAEAVRRAVVDAFISLNEAFECEGCRVSGSTVSVALARGWLLTVANVGDSEVFLDVRGQVIEMTCCHKLNDNKAEQERLKSAGVKLDKLGRSKCGPPGPGEKGFGPLRAWPGGIAMSRSLGDIDCGPHVLPVPHVRQVAIPSTGARLVMASDGLWDHISGVKACKHVRGWILKHAPEQLINLARNVAGQLSDDTTILVVDMLPCSRSDFSGIAQSVGKKVTRSLKTVVRNTLRRGRRLWVGAKSFCKYYADVDGMLEYPDALQADLPMVPYPPVSIENEEGELKWRGEGTTISSTDAWDMCSAPWDYTAIQRELWISTTLDDRLQGEVQGIMDTAESYADHLGMCNPRHKLSVPHRANVAFEEAQYLEDGSKEILDVIDEEF